MIELLKLCGYRESEIEVERPRVEKAFKKLGIDADDIECGKQRLAKYYDIELKGLRRLFRLCLRQLVDMLLVREEGDKKVIYGFMSPGIDMLGAAFMNKSRDVFVIHQSWAFHIVVGCIFGKIVPVMEAAEQKWLKAGLVAHCANVKTLVGPVVLGLFPKPDLLVTSGFTCETSPKTINLLHELYNIPVYYVETCQDRESWEYPEPVERISDLTARSMRGLAEKIKELVGFGITDDDVREVQDVKGRFDEALNRIRKLVVNSDPLPLSPAHENIWMCVNMMTLNLEDLAEATAALDLLYEELRERVARGEGVVEKGAPRVMAILPAGQTDPRMEQLACEVGIAIVAIDMSFGAPFEATSEDPYLMHGMGLQQHTLGLPLRGRIPLIIDACKKLKVDGVLDRYHVGCRSVSADALLIEEAIKKELDLPVLVMEWENFDPRAYDDEQFRSRFEAFREMMNSRRP